MIPKKMTSEQAEGKMAKYRRIVEAQAIEYKEENLPEVAVMLMDWRLHQTERMLTMFHGEGWHDTQCEEAFIGQYILRESGEDGAVEIFPDREALEAAGWKIDPIEGAGEIVSKWEKMQGGEKSKRGGAILAVPIGSIPPCKCGNNELHLVPVMTAAYQYVKCPQCGRKGDARGTLTLAISSWKSSMREI